MPTDLEIADGVEAGKVFAKTIIHKVAPGLMEAKIDAELDNHPEVVRGGVVAILTAAENRRRKMTLTTTPIAPPGVGSKPPPGAQS